MQAEPSQRHLSLQIPPRFSGFSLQLLGVSPAVIRGFTCSGQHSRATPGLDLQAYSGGAELLDREVLPRDLQSVPSLEGPAKDCWGDQSQERSVGAVCGQQAGGQGPQEGRKLPEAKAVLNCLHRKARISSIATHWWRFWRRGGRRISSRFLLESLKRPEHWWGNFERAATYLDVLVALRLKRRLLLASRRIRA